MKCCLWLWVIGYGLLTLASCQRPVKCDTAGTPCADALMAYAEQYPEAEPTDRYKLVFQDLYGPGHLIADSVSCAQYIEKEVAEMAPSALFPLFEYTLCDSNFVRVNLQLVKDGRISARELTRAVLCSAEGMPTPDPKFVQSHSSAFKAAYDPHYRIVRRDIFEKERLPTLNVVGRADGIPEN